MGSRDVCLVFVWCVTHLYLEKMESYCDAKVDLYSSFSLYLFFFFFFFYLFAVFHPLYSDYSSPEPNLQT
jgi:hypothetical protein